jgi:cyclopropane fatty-acyl-phospholipid synthase-like methyltransferase
MSMSEPVWESFARDAPYWYVDMAHDGDMDRFWWEGRRTARHLLERARPHLQRTRRVVEIGCGVGRVLLPLAEHFDRAVGVDVAPTMRRPARTHAEERDLPVRVVEPSADWDDAGTDLVVSHITFRHIDRWSVIDSYIRRTQATLSPSGVAVFGFDTRPRSVLYRIRNALPDPFLPKAWRRGARGIRHPPDTIRSAMAEANLSIVDEVDRRSANHTFVAVRAG